MIIAVPRETADGERRVALVPAAAATLIKEGHEVRVERGAGLASAFPDEQYTEKGASIVENRAELIGSADLVAQVRTAGANPATGVDDAQHMRAGQFALGFADPWSQSDALKLMTERGVTLLSMELIPRITRAQGMDALSSQANIAGYKAVIRASEMLGKIFPLLMTAAGTLHPARVFVIGAGVAGLQAIATAKRLGAVVSAYDVRPVVKEQVESLGARFVQLPPQAAGEQDKYGYAKAQTEEQIERQRELMMRTVADSDVVITTALIPGKPAPRLITREMVEGMASGSIIVDLAAERGGNCELTEPNRTVDHNGVSIVGDTNLPSAAAHHSSQMYAGNVVQLVKHLFRKGATALDLSDEITSGVVVCRDGQIVHPRVREALGMPPLEPAVAPDASPSPAG